MINFERKKEEKNLFQSSAGNKPNKGFAENGFGISELAASLTVITLHLWKRNPMLSILCGTILYMVLVQKVF